MVPFWSPNEQSQSTEGKNITFHGLAYPKLTWGSSNFVSDHHGITGVFRTIQYFTGIFIIILTLPMQEIHNLHYTRKHGLIMNLIYWSLPQQEVYRLLYGLLHSRRIQYGDQLYNR